LAGTESDGYYSESLRTEVIEIVTHPLELFGK